MIKISFHWHCVICWLFGVWRCTVVLFFVLHFSVFKSIVMSLLIKEECTEWTWTWTWAWTTVKEFIIISLLWSKRNTHTSHIAHRIRSKNCTLNGKLIWFSFSFIKFEYKSFLFVLRPFLRAFLIGDSWSKQCIKMHRKWGTLSVEQHRNGKYIKTKIEFFFSLFQIQFELSQVDWTHTLFRIVHLLLLLNNWTTNANEDNENKKRNKIWTH